MESGPGAGANGAGDEFQSTINGSAFERGLSSHEHPSILSSTRIEEPFSKVGGNPSFGSRTSASAISRAGFSTGSNEPGIPDDLTLTKRNYWKLRAWFMGLEKIVISESGSASAVSVSQVGSGTGTVLTSELKSKLRQVLTDSALVKFIENDDFLSAKNLFYSTNLITGGTTGGFTKTELRIINRLITKELQTVINQISNSVSLITGTDTKIQGNPDLVQTIQKLVDDKNLYETQVKSSIVQLDQNIRNYEVGLGGLSQEIAKLEHYEQKELVPVEQKYMEFLKVRDEMIAAKLKLDHMKEFIASHPIPIVDELEEVYLGLLKKIDKLEGQIKEVEAKKAAYESLGPEFKDLITEWTVLNEKIQSKRWVLNELNMAADLSLSMNDSTSFIFQSP